jgi:bacterioferritin
MGELGREVAGGTAAEDVLPDLIRAYADEWFAHYNFQFTANTLWGHRSPSTTDLLSRKSAEAFARANRLAQRILQLGGQPVASLTNLAEHATDKPFKLPQSMSDVQSVLKAVLDAERTSLRTYHELYSRTRDHDPVTAALAQQYLMATVYGEEELERLIGDPAPGMRGT